MPRNRQATENRIRQAARDLLRVSGFEGWGVNAVARQAGIDKVLVYRYFGSPEALLMELVRDTDFWPHPDTLPDHAPEAFLRHTLEMLADSAPAPAFLALPPDHPLKREVLRLWNRHLDRWILRLRSLTHGSLPESDWERLAAQLFMTALTGRLSASPARLWHSLSPPLQWGASQPDSSGELPTELL